MAAREYYSQSQCVLNAMDALWFQKIIFLSEPIEPISPTPTTSSRPKDVVGDCSSTTRDTIKLRRVFTSPKIEFESEDIVDAQEDEGIVEEEDEKEEIITKKNNKEHCSISTTTVTVGRARPANLIKMKKSEFRSNSLTTMPTSDLMRRRRCGVNYYNNNNNNDNPRLRLARTMSCKGLGELEEEEVKGFMDLGFTFDRDRLTPRMMSVIPGLQRHRHRRSAGGGSGQGGLGGGNGDRDGDGDGDGDESLINDRSRPYLSEAWLINKPDSPLMRVRLPKLSTGDDDHHMKRHLKLWAKIVANFASEFK